MGAGKFIAFEGPDLTGKTTQAAALAEHLGHDTVLLTREPGGTPLGQQLRQMILHGGHLTLPTEALLFAADRADHVANVIRPALEAGHTVICDRYIDSSRAYQSWGPDALPDYLIRELSHVATGGLLPDLTIFLDGDPDRLAARRAGRNGGAADRIEATGLARQRHARDAFLAFAQAAPDRSVVINAERDPAEIAGWVIEQVQQRLHAAGAHR